MLSAKPWRVESVILLMAALLIFWSSGLIAINVLHNAGITGFKQPEDFGNALVITLCFQGATLILIPIFLRWHHVGLRETFGFHKAKLSRVLLMTATMVIVILPVALLLEAASIAVLEKFGWQIEDEAAVKLVMNAKILWEQIYLGVLTIAIVPVAEEFIFRGVLFPFAKQLGFPKLAWFGVSALFALIHFDAAIFMSLFVLALALTWLYEKTDNLLAPIVAHSLFNSAGFIMILFNNQLTHVLKEISQSLRL